MKIISNYTRYCISPNGAIYDSMLNKEIFPSINQDGYAVITLRKDDNKRKTLRVHRLVASTFILNPENKETVNHKDGNKINNNFKNLEWHTRSENIKHAWDNGLIKNMQKRKNSIRKKQGKSVLCITTGEVFNSCGEAAERKNLKKSNISAVCLGKKGFKSAGKNKKGEKLLWTYL